MAASAVRHFAAVVADTMPASEETQWTVASVADTAVHWLLLFIAFYNLSGHVCR